MNKNVCTIQKKLLVGIATLSLLLSASYCIGADTKAVAPTKNTCSKKCSLVNPRLLAGFNENVDEFKGGENTTDLTLIDSFPNWPFHLHEGVKCLKVSSPKLPANVWRTIYKTYPKGLDLSQTPIVEFGINTTGGGAAADYYVKLTLRSGDQTFESVAKTAPNEWCVTIFDLNACPFLNDIKQLDISFMNNSDVAWENADFMIDGLRAGNPLDLSFNLKGSATLFSAENGRIGQNDGALEFSFEKGGVLTSPSLENSRNSVYNPPLKAYNVTILPLGVQDMSHQTRNTLFFVMENQSTADKVRISFITNDDKQYDLGKSKVFDIDPNSPKKAYYFNLSDIRSARGHIAGFKVEPLNGSGKLIVDRITFEEEASVEPFAGKIISCTATKDNVVIKGSIAPELVNRYAYLTIYETAMYDSAAKISEMTVLYEGPIRADFTVDQIPLKRNANMTRLSRQFLVVAKNSDDDYLKIAPRFYIENWSDFEENPYAFTLPDRTAKVTDYGAKGDGFTDDTRSIQAAIDDVSAQGGGRVVLPGDDSFYGKRYVATHLMMRSNIDLHFEKGVVLWQSQNEDEYVHAPTYGHDVTIPNVPWTHAMHVSNLPFLQAKSVENIKITGPGKIRSSDTYCLDKHLEHYARTCTDRIHIIPIGFWDVKNIELTDFEMVRTNNYHMSLYKSENIFVGNVKMHEVKCVSGDGIGLSSTHDVKIVRIFLESNDDGVTLCSGFNDPRGMLWWWPDPENNSSVRNVVVCHSYINSGGGKAIALIPWGTNNPDQSKSELDNIAVYDNVLMGGYSVGVWPDNPFGGKMPFDNTETDDYAPVKNFRILNNEYRSECDLLCVKATNFITDCGIHSSETFRNGDFKLGQSYWTLEGQAGVRDGYAYTEGGRLYEGLYLKKGRHTFTVEVNATGELFIENALTGKTVKTAKFKAKTWTPKTVTVEIDADDTYYLGVTGSAASIRNAVLTSELR